jgi:hypothetical protein
VVIAGLISGYYLPANDRSIFPILNLVEGRGRIAVAELGVTSVSINIAISNDPINENELSRVNQFSDGQPFVAPSAQGCP